MLECKSIEVDNTEMRLPRESKRETRVRRSMSKVSGNDNNRLCQFSEQMKECEVIEAMKRNQKPFCQGGQFENRIRMPERQDSGNAGNMSQKLFRLMMECRYARV
jgi:hypothetical protein